MNLFTPEFRTRCEYLSQAARRSWGTRFLGRRLEHRWAGGSEFVGHSDYTSGDDIRRVDWNVCARHDELLTRQYRGSEDRVVYLLLDASIGMSLGQPGKFDVARQLAASLGYLALDNLDRVGIAAVSNRILATLEVARGRNQAERLFRFLAQLESDSRGGDLRSAVEAFVQNRPRRGTTVVISDLFDPAGFSAAIDVLVRRGFSPYLLQVVDPSELDPDYSGRIRFVDVVSGASRATRLEAVDRANYRHVMEDFHRACHKYCAGRGIGFCQAKTTTPIHQSIMRMIRTSTSRMYAS